MSKAIAIAQREIQERWMVFVAAAAIAAAPFIGLLMPGGSVAARLEAVKIIGSGLAASFICGLAALLGASIVGRESRERRLSFYFARPVGGAAIWSGKMIGALFLLAASAAIMFIPPLLIPTTPAQRGLWSISTTAFMGMMLAVAFALVPLFHVASTMVRSRSLLVAADFIGVIVFGMVCGALLLPLVMHYALNLYLVMLLSIAVAVVVLLLLAGGWQLVEGRTDVRRSHRVVSAFVWSGAAIIVLVVAAVMAWVKAVGPNDLKDPYAVQFGNGAAVAVAGRATYRLDYGAAFLADINSGRVVRVSPASQWNSALSGDGRTAAWIEAKPSDILESALSLGLAKSRAYSLVTANVAEGTKPVDTGIEVLAAPETIALSDDGQLAAIFAKEVLSVFDLRTGRNVGSAHVPGRMWTTRVQFIGPDEVRVYTGTSGGEAHVSAWSYSLRERKLKQLLDYVTPANWFYPAPSPDGKRLFVRINRSKGVGPASTVSLAVFDVDAGKLVTEVTPAGFGMLLTDGRIAALTTRGGNASVLLFDASGAQVRTIPVAAPAGAARFAGVLEPGVVAVATAAKYEKSGEGWTLSRVDLDKGVVTPIAKGLAPVLKYPFGVEIATQQPRVVQPMVDENRHIVAVDIRNGARKRVL